MARIVSAFSLATGRKRLTGTAPRPNRDLLRPACELKGSGPDPDAGEGVELGGVPDPSDVELFDVFFKNLSWSYCPRLNEVAHPGAGVGVYFIIDDHISENIHLRKRKNL